MKKFLRVFLLSVIMLFSVSLAAPEKASAVDKPDNGTEINYQENSRKLQAIEDMLKKGETSTQKMSDEVQFLEENRISLLVARKNIEQELKFVQKRIEALGEAPEDGKELSVIAQQRDEFGKEEVFQKGRLAEADILLARIDELNALILDIRNKELLGNLITKQTPLYHPEVLLKASEQFVQFVFDIIKSPVEWYG